MRDRYDSWRRLVCGRSKTMYRFVVRGVVTDAKKAYRVSVDCPHHSEPYVRSLQGYRLTTIKRYMGSLGCIPTVVTLRSLKWRRHSAVESPFSFPPSLTSMPDATYLNMYAVIFGVSCGMLMMLGIPPP